ncbi:putative mitochondrial carrier protein [Trypanosoma grayi]|uniref:putative mitochondrial carrier protein n=1 Tax=Trypanosoma grayi TaxID=71804 RepID=UPI0004F42FE8|nr:putative mitochondrial carrier protein [Trypanosoma grayi]KEG08595.1 putative mitochondrial carrier protein [Trypanosoma grayi]
MSASQTSPPGAPAWHSSRSGSFWYDLLVGPGGAATLAGVCEIIIFHPFDTTAKRLMSHQNVVLDATSLSTSWRRFQQVLFAGIEKDKAPGAPITFLDRVRHMYPGSSYAVMYKVLQRFIKFAGQPYMRDFLKHNFGHVFLGTPQQQQKQEKEKQQKGCARKMKYGSMALEATAGCLVGLCEVVLLPIDRMKVLNQTNKGAIQNRSFISILRREGIMKMYAGIGTTMVRNAPGSFLLFGGTACTKDFIFHLEDYSDATFMQNLVSSTVGSSVAVWFTSPMDVVKTRIQNKKFEEGRVTGWGVVKDTVRREGVMAFYKGIMPKLLTTAPRLVFSYTMTQYFVKVLRGEKKKPSST